VRSRGAAAPARETGYAARWLGVATLGALVVAALVPVARFPILAVLTLCFALAPRRSALSWAAAAALPVALNLGWGGLAIGVPGPGLRDCANLLSPPAVGRVAEAVVVCGLVVLLARLLRTDLSGLGLRRPTRPEMAVGLAALAVIPAGSLVLGSLLAEPFFGPVRLRLEDPLAIVPALALAIANGIMEEVIYRGTLMRWLTPLIGAAAALMGQAIVFGAAHTGSDFVASPLPVMLAVATGGLIAGLICRRTGSLAVPIVVHVAFDFPLYYAAACRLS
jgi:membrane protease YdiL (CAAX protease family)